MVNWIQLALLVCATAGKPCREERLSFADMSMMTCQITAWRYAAEWALLHEGYFVRRVRCSEPGREARL